VISDEELVKNILVKDFHNFMDCTFSFEDKIDPIIANNLMALKGQLWRHLRTNLTPVFTSRKMKMMFYLVDFCGKELADCLEKATADGKLPAISRAILCTGKFGFRNKIIQWINMYLNNGKFTLSAYHIDRHFTMPSY
jgi:hypothetical protein